MDLAQCQHEFKELLIKTNKSQMIPFLKWVEQVTAESHLKELAPDRQKEAVSSEQAIINQIQTDLRELLPLEATLPSEQIICPAQTQSANYDARTTVHVDGFLYDEEAIDNLTDLGKLSRNYCQQCGLHQVAPLTFISHSTSKTQLQFIFQYLLPDLRGKLLLDIGSRLGPVLYGAYLYSGASRIIGVEMNSDMCRLQQTITDKYCMKDRIQIVCDDICNQTALLAQADVIILNNVFEFFMDVEAQKRIWSLIQQSVRRPGVLLVVSPSLEESFSTLGLQELLSGWVNPVSKPDILRAADRNLFDSQDDSDLGDIYLYTVL